MKASNKVSIVTGASTGIGRAIAIEFAKQGIHVLLLGRSKDGLTQTLELVKQVGGTGEIFYVDFEVPEQIGKIGLKIKESYKTIDILVNVAGIWHSENKAFSGIDFADYSTDEILSTYYVGLIAPTLLAHEFIPIMRSRSKIVNISGTFENGAKGWLPYYVSKKGIEDLTVGLADELFKRGIQVNCVSPSDCSTEAYKKFFPEYATPEESILPEDVAHLVFYLCSKDSDLITGQIIEIKQQCN